MGCVLYKCFAWRGHRTDLNSFETRRDPDSGLPPVSVRAWTGKPDHLCRGVFHDKRAALSWMWDQMRGVATYMAQRYPNHAPDIARQFAAVAAGLDHADMACDWAIELPDRTCVVVAVVAVWDDEQPVPVAPPHRDGRRPPRRPHPTRRRPVAVS